jgi:hypothetical protein
VLNGFLAPPLLVLVMLVANDRAIHGPEDQRPLAERGRRGVAQPAPVRALFASRASEVCASVSSESMRKVPAKG